MKKLQEMTIDEMEQERRDIEKDDSINHLSREINLHVECNRRTTQAMERSSQALESLNEGINQFCASMQPHIEIIQAGIDGMRAKGMIG